VKQFGIRDLTRRFQGHRLASVASLHEQSQFLCSIPLKVFDHNRVKSLLKSDKGTRRLRWMISVVVDDGPSVKEQLAAVIGNNDQSIKAFFRNLKKPPEADGKLVRSGFLNLFERNAGESAPAPASSQTVGAPDQREWPVRHSVRR